MADNKKISELGRLTGLGGNELFVVASSGNNYSVSAQTLKENAQQGMMSAEEGKGLSSNDYTEEDKQKLAGLPTAEELEGQIDAAKLAVFADEWNVAWGAYGRYDPANAPDALHPFMGNDIWMTYEDAVKIKSYYSGVNRSNLVCAYLNYPFRVLPPLRQNDNQQTVCSRAFMDATNLEVVNLSGVKASEPWGMFSRCSKLHTITGFLSLVGNSTVSQMFQGCASLVNIKLVGLAVSISFGDSPLLSLASMQYLVANAANTTAITITLHADAYARLTDELIAQATERQITFAST